MAGRYKKILVTGSTSGIGLELASQLLSLGYFVIFHGLGKNTVAYDDLKTKYPEQIDFWAFDLSLDPEVSLEELFKKHGHIYGLVNNAGIIPDHNFFEASYENLNHLFKINAFAPLLISKVFMKFVDPSIGGRIVNISSIAVKFGMGRNNTIQYANTKASIESLTTGLAKIGAPKNILVNAIRPGCILTRIQKDRPDFNQRVSMIPVKRMGTENEVSSIIEYLLSERASFITGQVIAVAGGE